MIIRRLVIFLILLIVSFSGIVRGEISDPCGCNAGLVEEVVQQRDDQSLSLAFLKQIDEEQYNQLRKTVDTSFKYYELISGTGSYGDFNEARRRYLEHVEFRMDSASSRSYLLSRIQTEGWTQCKLACIKSRQGFYCDAIKLSPNLVTASCRWNVEGVNQPKSVTVEANGQTMDSFEIPPNTNRYRHFPRDPNTDLILTFTPEGISASTIKIDRIPPPPKAPECRGQYVKPQYTTQNDTRVSTKATCPKGLVVRPDTARCYLTSWDDSNGHHTVKASYLVGDDTWVCVFDPPLAVGVGMWAEMYCDCKH